MIGVLVAGASLLAVGTALKKKTTTSQAKPSPNVTRNGINGIYWLGGNRPESQPSFFGGGSFTVNNPNPNAVTPSGPVSSANGSPGTVPVTSASVTGAAGGTASRPVIGSGSLSGGSYAALQG